MEGSDKGRAEAHTQRGNGRQQQTQALDASGEGRGLMRAGPRQQRAQAAESSVELVEPAPGVACRSSAGGADIGVGDHGTSQQRDEEGLQRQSAMVQSRQTLTQVQAQRCTATLSAMTIGAKQALADWRQRAADLLLVDEAMRDQVRRLLTAPTGEAIRVGSKVERKPMQRVQAVEEQRNGEDPVAIKPPMLAISTREAPCRRRRQPGPEVWRESELPNCRPSGRHCRRSQRGTNRRDRAVGNWKTTPGVARCRGPTDGARFRSANICSDGRSPEMGYGSSAGDGILERAKYGYPEVVAVSDRHHAKSISG